MTQIVMELVFEFSSPNTVASSSIAHGITSLDDKALHDTMEGKTVVVFVPAVHHKVLDGLGAEIGEQLEGHVTLCGVDRGKRAQTDLGRLDDRRSFFFTRSFVEHITSALVLSSVFFFPKEL